MKFSEMQVLLCDRSEIKDFIETWHYSKSINGLKTSYCFKLVHNDIIIGAMLFGSLGMAGVYKKYVDTESEIIELRRLCCIDDTPKCTESFFVGKAIKWLKKNTQIKKIISYADLHYNHEGIIYKASNFKLLGKTSPSRVINWNGKTYHDKAIRTKYNGKLKPFAQRLLDALIAQEAFYETRTFKNIYMYCLVNNEKFRHEEA